MRRSVFTILLMALVAAFFAAICAVFLIDKARADFELSNVSVAFTDAEGSEATAAGTHPFAFTTHFDVNTVFSEAKGVKVVDGALRNLDITMPPGFVGNPTATPRCTNLDFLTNEASSHPSCADGTALGILLAEVGGGTGIPGKELVAVYNLEPSPGTAAKLGFWVGGVPTTIDVAVSPDPPYNVTASLHNASQIVEVLSATTTLWGNPADPVHDPERGRCAYEDVKDPACPAGVATQPFLTLPRSCQTPLAATFEALSWWSGNPLAPGGPASFTQAVPLPNATECSRLGFAASLDVQPTTSFAESPTGLDAELQSEDEGLGDPQGTAHSDIQQATLTLPEGITANPSLAEGLATCSRTQIAEETPTSAPGQGCPLAAKIGTVKATTPILEGTVLEGSLYIAAQDDPATTQPGAENPFDSLLAFYVVVKDPGLGLIVRQAAKIEPDPATGQLRTILPDLPPFPLGHVSVHLREGGRSPLISPPGCGEFTSRGLLTPSGDPANPVAADSSFRISAGVGGGACPSGPQPFEPGFSAGTLNNNAASFSPFNLRLTRRDGDQDLTRFDAVLPPGVLAKLKGVGKCPDAAIAQAKAKRGKEELANPSCPASSQIGTVLGGAGVGSELTYAKGKLYLAGPFARAPLSVVGIVPAVAGPFDVGTIVVRQALQLNAKSAEAEVDGAHSDPIPHILAGIPLKVRDVRVEVDRPKFTLNPTNCDPFAIKAAIWGGGANVFSAADDSPVARSVRFQAANCARLGFKPRLSLALKGGTARGAHPALTSVFKPGKGNANLKSLSVRLPRSAFLEQGHIRTVCTRVQFAANSCPTAAIYGHVSAITPLLDEPLKGPVYLRSSNHNLPDLVLDLHGIVDVEVSARIDSVKGGIRATISSAPDAPLTKAVLRMQGGKKGLVVNSRDLCAAEAHANVGLQAQNGKRRALRPLVRAKGCAHAGGKHRKR